MIKTGIRYLVVLLWGALIVWFSSTAMAQDIDNKFVLGFSQELFEFSSEIVSIDAPDGYYDDDSVTVNQISFGILPSLFGIDLGFGLTNMLVLGCNLQFSFNSLDSDNTDSESVIMASFLPHLDLVIGEGQTIRPFCGILGGIQVISESSDSDDDPMLGFLVGLRGGLHIFVAEEVTIDPMLGFMYGSSSYGESEFHVRSMTADLYLGLTAWI